MRLSPHPALRWPGSEEVGARHLAYLAPPCPGPPAALRHVIGFPGRGLLRRLRHRAARAGEVIPRSGDDGRIERDGGGPFVPLNALIGHRQPAGGWHRLPHCADAAGCSASDVVRRVGSWTAGDWASGNPALTRSRGSCGSSPYTSSDGSASPTGSGPRWLSPQGESGDPRPFLLV